MKRREGVDRTDMLSSSPCSRLREFVDYCQKISQVTIQLC